MRTPQWKVIADEILAQIESGSLMPGQKLPGEEEIAHEWKVSRPTAHRALSELQRLGVVARQRRWGTVVIDREHQSTNMVAIIIDRFARAVDFPQSDLIRGIQDTFGDTHSLVWCDSKNDPHREAHFLRTMSKNTDGIILYPSGDPQNTAVLKELDAAGKPVVLLDRVPEGYQGTAILSDDTEVTYRAISMLADRGHRNIAFFGFHKPNISNVLERYGAFERALKDKGLNAAKNVRWFGKEYETEGDLQKVAVFDALFSLTKSSEPVTAVYCIQDCLATSVFDACERLDIEVPANLEIVTVNEWPSLMLKRPWDAHRIVRRKYDIGVEAAQRLKARIDRKAVQPEVVRIPAELFVADLNAMSQFYQMTSMDQ